jgi:hypothetical protein
MEFNAGVIAGASLGATSAMDRTGYISTGGGLFYQQL